MVWCLIFYLFLFYDQINCHEQKGISLELFSQSRMTVDGRQMRRYLQDESPHAPLYRGFGTHFTYAWVGTPPRRVSLIVDTGSHYTAFPCKSCTNCGKHTDHYWDPELSSTSVTLKCGTQRCSFSQSYTEGSSWNAYKVRDVFALGGERYDMLSEPLKWSVNFTFGCQTSETGLFRTQMENGIMGMSSDANTLPFVLYDHDIISSTMFSLCLLPSGGVMSIGSINSNLHQSSIQYATLLRKTGYFSISVQTIYFKKPLNHRLGSGQENQFTIRDLNEPKSKYNSGKGIILDSGTTDTYLPSAIAIKFKQIFHEITGIKFTNSIISLTSEQFQNMPTIVYRLDHSTSNSNSNSNIKNTTSTSSQKDQNKKLIEIEFPPQHYLERVLGQEGKYLIRLYLTESTGGVIGANMMTGYNIIFDQINLQVGFAKSNCKIKGQKVYDEMTKPKKISRHLREGEGGGEAEGREGSGEGEGDGRGVGEAEGGRVGEGGGEGEVEQEREEPQETRKRDLKESSNSPPFDSLLIQKSLSLPSNSVNSIAFDDINKFIQSDSFDDCLLQPLGPCNARCDRGPSRSLGRSRTISQTQRQNIRHYKRLIAHANDPHSSNYGYFSEGYQRYLMNSSCLHSHYLKSKSFTSHLNLSQWTSTHNSQQLHQFKSCYLSCDSTQHPITYLHSQVEKVDHTPFCFNSSWGECQKDCYQRRFLSEIKIIRNVTDISNECQEVKEFEKRGCSKQQCVFSPNSECAYIVQMTIPSFDDRLWSLAWRDELIYGLSETLQMDSSHIDIPIPPAKATSSKKQVVFHIRVPLLEKNIPIFDPSSALFDPNKTPKLSSSSPKCSKFPLLTSNELLDRNYDRLKSLFLQNLYSISTPVCGDWRWITNENTNFFLLQPEKGNILERTVKYKTASTKSPPHPPPSKSSTRLSQSLVDFKNSRSLTSLLCVGGVVFLTIFFYFSYQKFHLKMREGLEKPREGIEGRYRMVGYSR